MSKSQKRAQRQKPLTAGRNQAFNTAMQEIGRSSATSRHRSARDYRRKPKHAGKGWE